MSLCREFSFQKRVHLTKLASFQDNHGSPTSPIRHLGDFGNLAVDENGVAKIDLILAGGSSLFGPEETSILGRTLVIHEKEDDLGVEDDDGSRATGNAGARLACAIIQEPSEWDLTLIIIIVLVVVIVLLAILICCLCYCCCKR